LLISLLRCYTLALHRRISLRHYAQCAFIRVALHNLTPHQLQFMQAPTVAVYNTWLTSRQSRAAAKAKRDASDAKAAFLASRLKVDTKPLPDGRSSILWIGDRHKASKFVLFLHGGGYIAPAMPGHMEWCARAYLLASPAAAGIDKKGEDEEVAVAVLQYTLCPDGHYPTQLQQAADAMAHLFASGRVTPGNLVIGGDSAGGNLTAQVLGHLVRPHPAAREVVLGEPLAGAFLVSPWVSGRKDWASMQRNAGIDMISAKLRSWALEGEDYLAEVKERKNGWAMPMDLEDAEGWFRGLNRVVKEVYVTAGEQEVLLDQGVAFAEAVRRGNPGTKVRLEVMKDEAHDWILMEGEKAIDGDATQRMRKWFTGLFWASSVPGSN
jgi:acetyl esterase/lipase